MGLPRVLGGLVALGRGIDLALQLPAHGGGGIIGAFLCGLLLCGADASAVGKAADPGEAGGQRARQGQVRCADHDA